MLKQALADGLQFLAKYLRALEIRRAKGDAEKIQQIKSSPDDELVRKWLWVVAIVGAPVSFIAAPFAISLLQPFLFPWLAASLWIVAKTCMVFVFLIFILAAVFTLKSSQ
jgi:hypothetical protein